MSSDEYSGDDVDSDPKSGWKLVFVLLSWCTSCVFEAVNCRYADVDYGSRRKEW